MNEAQDIQQDDREQDRPVLSAADKRWLLGLARRAVEAAAARRSGPAVDGETLSPAVRSRAACFVTLYRFGELRGCIGSRSDTEELWRAVIESARSSATQDPRFIPVMPDEVGALELHISVLTPMKPLTWRNEEDLRAQLKPFVHGVRIRNGIHRGLYLPTVWEHFAGASDIVAAFLGHLSQKAGDRSGTLWRDPNTAYEVFEALEFGEADADLAG